MRKQKEKTIDNPKLAALFLLGCMLFNYPLMSLFNVGTIFFGIPLLYLYIFSVWLLFVMLIGFITRRPGRSGKC